VDLSSISQDSEVFEGRKNIFHNHTLKVIQLASLSFLLNLIFFCIVRKLAENLYIDIQINSFLVSFQGLAQNIL